MRSTMQEFQLTIGALHAARRQVHADGQVVTATADGSRSESYAELGKRAARLANALRCAGHHRRPAGRHLPVEQRRAPRGLPRDPVDGRGAAHPEHPALPRAARLHRQPRRGQGRHRRRLAGRPARQAAAEARDRRARRGGRARGAAPAEPRLAARGRQGGAPLRGPAGRRSRRPSTGRSSTSATPSAMCYTSGTTGNPKGVVYSHRTSYLHSMGVALGICQRASPGTTGCCRSCRCSTPTPGACPTPRSWPARRW